jgi:hypothetical protein
MVFACDLPREPRREYGRLLPELQQPRTRERDLERLRLEFLIWVQMVLMSRVCLIGQPGHHGVVAETHLHAFFAAQARGI